MEKAEELLGLCTTHRRLRGVKTRPRKQTEVKTNHWMSSTTLLVIDGCPRTPSGHEGDWERTGGQLRYSRVMGRMGGSPAKLMGVENGMAELPRGLPYRVLEFASFAGRVDDGGLVGFTRA